MANTRFIPCSVKKKYKIVIVLWAVILIGWLAIHYNQSKEPEYRGKTVAQWLLSGVPPGITEPG